MSSAESYFCDLNNKYKRNKAWNVLLLNTSWFKRILKNLSNFRKHKKTCLDILTCLKFRLIKHILSRTWIISTRCLKNIKRFFLASCNTFLKTNKNISYGFQLSLSLYVKCFPLLLGNNIFCDMNKNSKLN